MERLKHLVTNSDFWLQLAFLISLSAVLGSMFLSQAMNLLPCELCWWQRVFMFPIPIILGLGMIRKDYRVYTYALPLAVVGALIALYHYSVQMIPRVTDTCGASTIACSQKQIELLGFMTIPFGSLLAFIAIAFCLEMLRRSIRA